MNEFNCYRQYSVWKSIFLPFPLRINAFSSVLRREGFRLKLPQNHKKKKGQLQILLYIGQFILTRFQRHRRHLTRIYI